MTTLSITQPRRRPGRTLLIAATTLITVFALVFFALPPGRRLLAGPARQAPIEGVTRIMVLGDPDQNHIYAPAVVRVPVGTTLTWIFADTGATGGDEPVPHDVVFTDLRSPIQATGDFQRTFTAPGSYSYVCSLHPFMEGRVEVVAP